MREISFKKKTKTTCGFTLIELLAVIVVLAIIALIATPIVMNVIKDAKEESNKRSIEMYAKALDISIAQYQLVNNSIPVGKYTTTDGKNLIKEGEATLIIDYNGEVMSANIIINDDGTFHISECEINGVPVDYEYGVLYPESFSTDRWDVIASNINSSVYNVGDTREIEMDVDGDGIKTTYTVRIANLPSQQGIEDGCGTDGFSETACGFVVEFEDIITKHNMNSKSTNKGGWPASEMRKYIGGYYDENNNFEEGIIYKALPEKLKSVIKLTKVISGYGSDDTSNFVSNDKLYLLSYREVFGQTYELDSGSSETITRQLDYYKNSTKDDKIKQYNGENDSWRLRFARLDHASDFGLVLLSGKNHFGYAGEVHGIAPAFRIG